MLVPGNRDDGKKEQLTDSLMREVADGDRAAFEQLYRITQNSVYCYLLAIVKSHSTAEDLMQDTYLSVRKSIQHYILRESPWLGFLQLLEIWPIWSFAGPKGRSLPISLKKRIMSE